MDIPRTIYLERLKHRRHNRMVKVVTGIRRCGKSYLLFKLFKDFLLRDGVDAAHIVEIDLDNWANRELRDPERLYAFVESRMTDSGMFYILIDEVQWLGDFEAVLNGLMRKPNADVYVTGSNARLLSKDVVTEFRGRGDEVRVHPLCFAEYLSAFDGSRERALNDFLIYGGLPQIAGEKSDEYRSVYLKNLFTETYLRDIKERTGLRNADDFDELLDVVASNIGGLTNPVRLADIFKTVKKSALSRDTIKTYLDYLEDAFLIERATRFDVKGNRYIDTPFKFYFEDPGLRNARLNFRQVERTHLMENLIYNELRVRGFNVDVGVVPVKRATGTGQQRAQLEIDFVCNLGGRRYYIQSAWRLDSGEKLRQEQASLLRIKDSFKKIIVVGEDVPVTYDTNGIMTIGIYDFLLRDNALEL